jgi:hypothetical protein
MFVFITSDDTTQCDPSRVTLAMQTVGSADGGWIGSWTSGDLIVSLEVGDSCHTAFYEVTEGTLEIVATSPTLQGSFTASFDGGTLVGTFNSPLAFPLICLVPCDGGVCFPTCDGG